jgi:hypothetical protein
LETPTVNQHRTSTRLRKQLELAPFDWDQLNDLLADAGADHHERLESFERVLATSPELWMVWVARALVQHRLGDPCWDTLDDLAAGLSCYHHGDLRGTVRALDRVLYARPACAAALRYRGLALLALSDLEGARPNLDAYLDQCNGRVPAVHDWEVVKRYAELGEAVA